MIKLKTAEEIEILREGGKRLAWILHEIERAVKPGVKTIELENLARKLIKEGGDEPAFLNYRPTGAKRGYPAALCVSINEEIVHGIPSEREIREGDIVGLDLGLNHDGLFTDMALSVPVGDVSSVGQKMIETANQALRAGLAEAKPGKRIGDISAVIEKIIEEAGFQAVRELSGHGVGYSPHEDPFIPNYGQAGTGPELVPGMVLAIEPMVTDGSGDIKIMPDGFTFVTKDGKLATHAEKTVVITETGVEILTG